MVFWATQHEEPTDLTSTSPQVAQDDNDNSTDNLDGQFQHLLADPLQGNVMGFSTPITVNVNDKGLIVDF